MICMRAHRCCGCGRSVCLWLEDGGLHLQFLLGPSPKPHARTNTIAVPMTSACWYPSLSHLELRRRELEKQIAAERAAELDMHQQWKGLMDRLGIVKSSADEKDREYKAAQEALRYVLQACALHVSCP